MSLGVGSNGGNDTVLYGMKIYARDLAPEELLEFDVVLLDEVDACEP